MYPNIKLFIKLNALCNRILQKKNNANNYSNNPFKSNGNNFKGKEKSKKTVSIKKECNNPSCFHCNKEHDVSQCLKLHQELRPKKYGGYKDKGKSKNVSIVI